MTAVAHDLVPVTTRIEPELHRLLEEKSRAADRSLAAELRQAIRAHVTDAERRDLATSPSKAQVA